MSRSPESDGARRLREPFRPAPERSDIGITSLSDTPETRCAYYRSHCGLQAHVEHQTGRIILRVGTVAAITMPSGLGVRVKGLLAARNVAAGPVISHPRSQRWTFLAAPDIPVFDLLLYAEMYRASVTVAPVGAEVALPSPTNNTDAYRVWNTLPDNDCRPSAALVLEVVRDCAQLRRVTGAKDSER
ncbi:DNA-directed RNA polymerase subunit beta [Nocardia aurantiaca]|uniref:DNA-directed RNA polymerase subunit beta n=1 Tax=Nocardia aurantiaca TaxID=2675850 RepID=A0A6I3L3X5_9NOCA|nr:DNA-directed RNA polymerase subunit beta [Nocardia aurantiaca]MTE16251.1 DNA-directed RNA polymerase subunit beta [Nocardia aurantiaca]